MNQVYKLVYCMNDRYHKELIKMDWLLWFVVAFAFLFVSTRSSPLLRNNARTIDPVLKAKIKSYQDVATQIINFSLYGPGQNQSYNRLALFTDTFGPRLSGTKNLEDSIDYMLSALKDDGLDNVHGEVVNVTHWVRGKEYAILHATKDWDLAITGLGKSIGTNGELTADVIVVKSFDDLDSKSSAVAGKIVVYNQDFVSYSDTASYRVLGAARAAKYGAVATLIRSVTPQSIYSPHTGVQEYSDGIKKIPTACITVEDAEMITRMQARGWPLKITLYMEAQNLAPAPSRNTVAEVKGTDYPEQVVLVSGHLDSWDVGRGAMDDGGGAFISWQALSIIRQMGLKPKRTMRLVMWTDEEAGGVGSQQYYQAHKSEADNFSILFESDMGVFLPYGIRFTGSEQAQAIMGEIGQLLVAINSSALYDTGGETDTAWWAAEGVPLGSLMNHNEKYFWYHHSNGDTMTVLDPDQMNRCSAVFAVYAYVLADMEKLLPRK